MPSARRTIVIDRAPEQVFQFFADHANDPRWRPAVKEVDPIGPTAVGTRIHQVVQGPGGRGIPADIEVTACDAPTRYAFQVVAGPVRPRGEFRFAPSGTGTEVQLALDAELSGLKKLLMSGAVQRSMDSEMRALDTAKRAIEAG